jgi:hypothetical protein
MNGHHSSAVPPNTTVTAHKSPSSRLQFLRHLGALRKSNRDEVTIRTTDCLISSSSSMKCEETNRSNRKCASSGGGGGASLRKTITNMFHLKPPVRSNHGGNCVVGREDDPGGGGCDYRRKNNSSAGGFISRLTAKRHKSAVPPGKRALPPVPPPPSSNHNTVVVSSRTPSPQQQQLNGTVAERVPSPAAGLDAFDWVEGGGGLALDQSPELGVVAATSTSGAASPASAQSQMDFAASIEKVKDVSIFFLYYGTVRYFFINVHVPAYPEGYESVTEHCYRY